MTGSSNYLEQQEAHLGGMISFGAQDTGSRGENPLVVYSRGRTVIGGHADILENECADQEVK